MIRYPFSIYSIHSIHFKQAVFWAVFHTCFWLFPLLRAFLISLFYVGKTFIGSHFIAISAHFTPMAAGQWRGAPLEPCVYILPRRRAFVTSFSVTPPRGRGVLFKCTTHVMLRKPQSKSCRDVTRRAEHSLTCGRVGGGCPAICERRPGLQESRAGEEPPSTLP